MKWIHNYQLFLFDFDGILVGTEELHFKAYQKMCKARGFSLNWDEKTYAKHAMFSSTGLKEAIYKEFPALFQMEPSWDTLYKEKKSAYFELLTTTGVSLMPGVKELLSALDKTNIKRCVVTHSPAEQIQFIRKKHPILDSIPLWITREHYKEPKPSSECYHKAISLLKKDGDRVIGFEDSPRGLEALLGTEAEGVLISSLFNAKEVNAFSKQFAKSFSHYSSFVEFCAKIGS